MLIGLKQIHQDIDCALPLSYHDLFDRPRRHLVHSIENLEFQGLEGAPHRHKIPQRPARRPEHPPRQLVVIRVRYRYRHPVGVVEIEDGSNLPGLQRMQQPVA